MRWLLWRELILMTRTRGLWVATCAYLVVLAAFITVWGDGVPIMTGQVSEQFSMLQLALLLVTLPWAAARVAGDRRELTLVAALAACAPHRVVAAKFVALVVVLVAVAGTALPLKILALRISAVEPWRAALDLPVLALCMLTASLVTMTVVGGVSRFTAWLLGTGTTFTMAALVAPAQAPVVIVAALVMIALTAMHADQRLEYLPMGTL